jgi:hypothetical protein
VFYDTETRYIKIEKVTLAMASDVSKTKTILSGTPNHCVE